MLAAVAVLKGTGVFSQFLFAPPNLQPPPRPPSDPNLSVCPVLGISVFSCGVAGKVIYPDGDGGQGRGAGARCIAASPFEVSALSSIK